MPEIVGFIGTPLELQWTKGEKKRRYYSFRLAENSGKGEKRKTTWYTVRAFISESRAHQLCKGQPVRVRGRLDSYGAVSRDAIESARIPRSWEAIIKVLQGCAALESKLILMTSCVETYTFTRERTEEGMAEV